MLRRAFPDVYEGWIVVGSSGAVVLVVAAIFFYGFGTIFNDVRDEFGWSNASTALAFSLRNEVGGVGAILVGVALDRVGPRRVLYVGITVASAGVLAMSYMQELWHFYVVMVVVALGSSAAGGQVGLTAIATWFRDRRAFAMSVMTLGGGLGGIFVVGVAALVDAAGWRWALRVLAAFMLVVGLVIGSNVRARPRGHPQPLDGRRRSPGRPEDDAPDEDVERSNSWGVPVRAAITSRSFALLSLAMFGSSFGFVALAVHQIPYMETQIGVSKAVASSSVAVFTLASIVGRIGFGYLADRYSKRVMLALALALLAAGMPVLAFADSYWQAVLGIAIAAPGFGGTVPLRPAMAADYFGLRSFGTINGVVQFVSTTGGAAGPWVVGRIVDIDGDYTAGWLVAAAVVAMVGIPAALAASPPTALRDRHSGTSI
ncbi:MAG: MFS transporter [Chloroflexi bacterium]|nr:MFS transporter [Chloroflexota bacterium]